MEKITIEKAILCNKTLFKLLQEKTEFPTFVSFNLYKAMKKLEEVEEFVFNVLDTTFVNLDMSNLNEEQMTFYNKLIQSEIEMDLPKISESYFENEKVSNLTIEDISNLSIILDNK